MTSVELEAIERQLTDCLTGGEPPEDFLQQLGGWPVIVAIAPRLVDSPLLTPVVALVSRDISIHGDPDDEVVRDAVVGLVGAVTASTDPLQFAQGLGEFLGNQTLLEVGATELASRCLALAQPPQPVEGEIRPAAAQVSRHADALETYARLSIAGQASQYKLFGLIEDIVEPQPRRYAQAVLRSIGAAHNRWQLDNRVIDVIGVLNGVKAPAYQAKPDEAVIARNREYGEDVASDASWVSANVEMVRGFRAPTVDEASKCFGSALEALSFARTQDERDDVEVLNRALRLLQAFISDQMSEAGARSPAEWDLDLAEVEALVEQVQSFAVLNYGLGHWSGDRKQLVLSGWARLARDLAWLRDKIDRDSLYDAAVVLDDLLQIYTASHTYEIIDRSSGVDIIREVVRPAVANGFAAKAGLMRNLLDHIEFLRKRIEDRDGDASTYEERLEAALALQEAARASFRSAQAPPGKAWRKRRLLCRLCLRNWLTGMRE